MPVSRLASTADTRSLAPVLLRLVSEIRYSHVVLTGGDTLNDTSPLASSEGVVEQLRVTRLQKNKKDHDRRLRVAMTYPGSG